MRTLAAVACLALAALAVAGCSAPGCPEGGVGPILSKTLHVGTREGGVLYIEPAEVRVPHCSRVGFLVVNDDRSVHHTITVRDLAGEDIRHDVPGGKTAATQHDGALHVVASERGTFEILCEVAVPDHASLGMRALLVVE